MFKSIAHAVRNRPLAGRLSSLRAGCIGIAAQRRGFAADAKLQALVKEADAYRLAMDAGRVETEIRSFKAGQLDKTRNYTVYLKPGHRSLVLFRSPSRARAEAADAGRRLLADDAGEPAAAAHHADAEAARRGLDRRHRHHDLGRGLRGCDRSARKSVAGQPCIKLELTGHAQGRQLSARGGLAGEEGPRAGAGRACTSPRTSWPRWRASRWANVDGRRQVTTMTLTDHLQKERSTEVHYLSRTPKTLGDEWFNPAFLIRAESPQ
jgi:hypothetical protein